MTAFEQVLRAAIVVDTASLAQRLEISLTEGMRFKTAAAARLLRHRHDGGDLVEDGFTHTGPRH